MYWFTSIYAAIMAAILVFMGQIGFGEQVNLALITLLAVFGFILSLFGYYIMIALSLGHLNYILNIVVILYYWNKSEFYRDWEKGVHYKNYQRLFFEITIALFPAVLSFFVLRTLFLPDVFSESALFIIILVTIIGIWGILSVAFEKLYQWRWKGEFDKRNEVIFELFPRFKERIKDPKEEAMEIKKKIEELRDSDSLKGMKEGPE